MRRTMTDLAVAVTANDHIQGNPNAKIELVEYGDYECPYSGKAYPVIKEVQKHFGDDLKFVFRNFPLAFHPHALHAAVAAEVAGYLGKFWEMHDTLYEHQNRLTDINLISYAKSLGLNVDEFEKHFLDTKFVEKIKHDMDGALKSGFNGTPMFYINGVKYDGGY